MSSVRTVWLTSTLFYLFKDVSFYAEWTSSYVIYEEVRFTYASDPEYVHCNNVIFTGNRPPFGQNQKQEWCEWKQDSESEEGVKGQNGHTPEEKKMIQGFSVPVSFLKQCFVYFLNGIIFSSSVSDAVNKPPSLQAPTLKT